MPAPRGPAIDFAPARWWEKLLFYGAGRALLRETLSDLARTPPHLGAAARSARQRAAARRILSHLRVRCHFEGLEHLPARPHLIVALHEGIADALCLSQLPIAARFVARQEVFEWPMIGPAMTRMGHISIEPELAGSACLRLVSQVKAARAAGEHILFFPQGTVLGIEVAFRSGPFRIARALGMPLLPVVVTGSHAVWEHPFSPRLRYGVSASVCVMPPVGADQIAAIAPETLRILVQARMKRCALDGMRPAPRRYDPERDGYWDGFSFDIDPAFSDLHDRVQRHRLALAA